MRLLIAFLGILFAVAIFYFGFMNRDGSPFRQQNQPQLNVNLQEIKPAKWQPIDKDKLRRVNIDDDEEDEWLLFYKDGYSTGQIGAVIYDAQNTPRGIGVPIPQQAPVYLVPYRLMPGYRFAKNVGYLGDDGIEAEAVGLSPDQQTPDVQRSKSGASDNLKGDLLQIRGKYRNKFNRLSLFQWKGIDAGYVGVQAFTPGWLSLSETKPNEWGAWNRNDFIQTVWAWEPQTDRSNICRVAMWQLQPVGQLTPETRFVAHYDNAALYFCSGRLPESPAFPEGMVLKYLLSASGSRNNLLSADTLPAPLKKLGKVRVLYLETPLVTSQPDGQPVSTVKANFIAAIGDSETPSVNYFSTVWTVEMEPPAKITDPIRWRLTGVTLSQN